MCDIRNSSANPVTITFGLTPVSLLGASPRRMALVISGAAGAFSISPRADVVIGQGVYNFLAGQSWIETMTDVWLGSIIRGEWYIVGSLSSQTITILEILEDVNIVNPGYDRVVKMS